MGERWTFHDFPGHQGCVRDADRRVVAYLKRGGAGHLIAAAPQMLEALENMLAQAELVAPKHPGHEHERTAARAALSRAKGDT